MMKMKYAILTGAMLAAMACLAGKKDLSEQYENTDEPFELHGRLSIFCGTPSYRVWIIGTKRMLGVRNGVPPHMPKELRDLFTTTSVNIYADFKVTPLTKYRKGHMQIVRIDSVKNLVIYEHDKFKKKMKELVPKKPDARDGS